MKKVGIVQYSLDMEVVGRFMSVREAERAYGITHISAVCRRQRRSDGGYIWRYDDDESPLDFSRANWEAANPGKLEDGRGRKRRKYYEYKPKQGGNLVPGQSARLETITENTRNLIPKAEPCNIRSTEDYLVRIMKNYELILRKLKKSERQGNQE